VKGLPEPVHAWQPIGTRPASSRFEAQRPRGFAPLVGREAERGALARLWQDARRGRGQVALVSGEAGIGKSRLAAELVRELEVQTRAQLRFSCSSHRQHSPLHPCIQQLEHAAGFAREDGAAAKLAKLEAVLGEAPEQDLQLVAELLLLPTGERFPVLQFAPHRRRQLLIQALVGLLERRSRRAPLLVLFEDAHWSDESSRELLAALVARVAERAILLVVTARPEFDARWTRQAHVTRLALGQLGAAESAALVRWIAGERPLPARTVDDIVARTDGVPLYLEELTQAVLEGGAAPAARERPSVPVSLHASLLARLDRLGGAREIAEIAAAIGREFSGELLAHVAGGEGAGVAQALERLVESGLVVRREAPEGGDAGYAFRHALIRDAADGILLRDRRRALHARIAEAIEQHFPDRAAAQPDIVAQHCAEGGLAEKAVGYWLSAGHLALRRSAMAEALVYLRRGLDALRGLPESLARTRRELDLTVALGKAQIATQGYAVAGTGETFARARALCAQLGDPPQVLSVHHGLWTHALMRAELDSARQQALALLEQGEARGDPLWRLMGCRFSGVTHHPLGQFRPAQALLERGIGLYDPAQMATYAAITVDDPKVVMLIYLSWSLMCQGKLDEARRRSAEALEYARRLSHAYTLAHALTGAAFVALTTESPQAGLERLAELLPLLEEHGIAYYGAVGVLFRGWCLAALGEAEEAEARLREGMTAYRATGSTLYLSGFLRMSAEAHGRIGRASVARQQIHEAFHVMEATAQRWDEAELHRVYGSLLRGDGDVDGAAAAYRRAQSIALQQGAGLWALRAACDLARLRAEQGARAEAHELVARACAAFDGQADAPDLRGARSLAAALR
jgi:predicted ATPase/ABC-type transport system involved in cytochrome c biogenesis ATPase subunit